MELSIYSQLSIVKKREIGYLQLTVISLKKKKKKKKKNHVKIAKVKYITNVFSKKGH